jgi:hypothetical protein
MSGHAFARVVGFGQTLVPLTPCYYERISDSPPTLRLGYRNPPEVRQATVRFGGGAPEIELPAETGALSEVAELSEGPGLDHWRIETAPYSVAWPAGFDFYSSGMRQHPPFDLIGPENSLIYFQGIFSPERRPNLTTLRAANQTLRQQGSTGSFNWIELEYTHNNQTWHQRQYLVDPWPQGHFVLITTQCPEGHSATTAEAADSLAQTLEIR